MKTLILLTALGSAAAHAEQAAPGRAPAPHAAAAPTQAAYWGLRHYFATPGAPGEVLGSALRFLEDSPDRASVLKAVAPLVPSKAAELRIEGEGAPHEWGVQEPLRALRALREAYEDEAPDQADSLSDIEAGLKARLDALFESRLEAAAAAQAKLPQAPEEKAPATGMTMKTAVETALAIEQGRSLIDAAFKADQHQDENRDKLKKHFLDHSQPAVAGPLLELLTQKSLDSDLTGEKIGNLGHLTKILDGLKSPALATVTMARVLDNAARGPSAEFGHVAAEKALDLAKAPWANHSLKQGMAALALREAAVRPKSSASQEIRRLVDDLKKEGLEAPPPAPAIPEAEIQRRWPLKARLSRLDGVGVVFDGVGLALLGGFLYWQATDLLSQTLMFLAAMAVNVHGNLVERPGRAFLRGAYLSLAALLPLIGSFSWFAMAIAAAGSLSLSFRTMDDEDGASATAAHLLILVTAALLSWALLS